jgi:hypothetical protein
MRSYINYIIKLKFLLYFKAAFSTLITTNNILGGFRGARLALFNLEVVILKLNVQLRTLLLPPVSNAP